MAGYVTNYNIDSFFLDYNIYRTYTHNIIPKIELGQEMAFESDHAIFLKIIFYTPFKNAILSNTILSFNIKSVNDAKCSVQSNNVNLPSMACDSVPNDENIRCKLVESSMEYNIFCYKLDFGSGGKFTVHKFKLYLPSEDFYSGEETLIFEDNNEYPIILTNTNKEATIPTIQGKYITNPYNYLSYSKLELKIDLGRPAHPGMKIIITFDNYFKNSFTENKECKLSLSRINPFSLKNNTNDMDEYWTLGNSLISNCEISFDSPSGISQTIVTVTAILDDKIYKVENKLSKSVYIYIWPFKAINLDQLAIDLSIKVNEKYILSTVEPSDKKVYFSSINQNIYNAPINTDENNIFSIESITPNIYGALADYIFLFKKNGLNSISLAQIYFPKEITFECEECVKCYEVSDEMNMITCDFEDHNILNIFFSNGIRLSNEDISVLVTGIINPRISSSTTKYLYLNLINISSGSRVTLLNGYYEFDQNLIYTRVNGLRFFYAKDYVSSKNPREKSDYKFRIGFDYANRGYSNSNTILNAQSLLYIFFPRDYHLYINENPINSIVNKNINGNLIQVMAEAKILGSKIQIKLGEKIDTSTSNFKYIEIIINNIKNPNKIISSNGNSAKSKYTGYFKVVFLNKVNSNSDASSYYYYTTGINSNTYRTDLIADNSLRSNEYNWYRGNLVETENNKKNKLIIDVLYNNTYNFVFLQPGRYIKVNFLTSSEAENTSNIYLNPNSTSIYFSSDIVKTVEESYILPSLYGESYEFYMGVPCSTNEGIYVVSPIISNSDQYIEPPSIIVYVRQIEEGKIEFYQDDIGIFPNEAKARIYYYLSDINVDELGINWDKAFDPISNTNINVERILIPEKTVTNKSNKMTNIFSSITIKEAIDNFKYNYKGSINNKCYLLYPEDLTIQQMSSNEPLDMNSIMNYDLTSDLTIKNSENDANLSSNEIKLEFTPPTFQPAFIICELYCPYKKADDESELLFFDYYSMNNYLTTVIKSI